MSNKTPFLLGAFVGAAIIPMIGFGFFNWKLDGKAQSMAREAAVTGIADVLVPMCVARFKADPEVAVHTAALKAEQFEHPRVEYVEKGGWAMFEGQDRPVAGLARTCENAIMATF